MNMLSTEVVCAVVLIIAAIQGVYFMTDERLMVKSVSSLFFAAAVALCVYKYTNYTFQNSADLQLEKTQNENENLKRNLVQVYEAVRRSKNEENNIPPRKVLPTESKAAVEEEDGEDGKPYL